jgi:predicted acyl esterase
MSLSPSLPTATSEKDYQGMGKGLRFMTAPLEREVEITGPVAAKLHISSSTTDADLFLVLHVYDPKGAEVVFSGAQHPRTPVSQGWLRASHRRLDPRRSTEYRPYHTHDREEPLEPGKVYGLDIEIWPTSIVVPAGYRIGLSVRGTDYDYEENAQSEANLAVRSTSKEKKRGPGAFMHDDPRDRPSAIFGGTVRVRTGGAFNSHVLLPFIPYE